MSTPGMGAAALHGMVPAPGGGWMSGVSIPVMDSDAPAALPQAYVDIVNGVLDELADATRQFPPMHSMMEGYAILLEEVDELWAEVKANNLDKARAEAEQVAAMALRFLHDTEPKEGV